MARLGDIFTISSGGTPNKNETSYYANGTIPWVKTGDLKDKYVPKGIECITDEGLNNSSAKLFPRDTVLVAMYGATIGACSILSYEASTNQACAAFLPCEDVIPEYLFYFLSGRKDQFIKDGVGGAQPNISAGYLKNVKFELVSLDEQQKVIDRLSKVDDLISFRKQQLSKLDELVKSRFVEMFGGCKKHSSLEKYAILITKGASPKWQGVDYCEEGTLFVTSENVREGYLDLSKRKYLDDKINKIQSRSILKRNDILINIVGASIGRAAVYDWDEPANINQAVALVRVDYSQINQTYLMAFLNSTQAVEMYGKMKKGGARDNLSLQNIADLQIPVSPMELQNQFAAFIEQTDKSKFEIQKSLEKLETLKKALMQKYFG